MRRIAPLGARTVSMPSVMPEPASGQRGLFAPARIVVDGVESQPGCLRCPDTPCVRFDDGELNAPVAIPTPVSPEAAVCPTGALGVDAAGSPVIDPLRCVGCGLCAVRCPVAAIHLDPSTAVAVVAPAPATYVSRPFDPVQFPIDRARLSASFVEEEPPFVDAGLVGAQLLRFDMVLPSAADAQSAFRLLTRNALLLRGLPARLKNVGDNAAFAELAAGDGGKVLVLEIEPRGDVLDALRRILAGVAIVQNRYGVDADDVIPSVVVRRLPNERTDYYRVLVDAAERVGVEVRTLPVAVLLLAIRGHGRALPELIYEQGVLGEAIPDLSSAVSRRWGPLASPQGLGLAPEK